MSTSTTRSNQQFVFIQIVNSLSNRFLSWVDSEETERDVDFQASPLVSVCSHFRGSQSSVRGQKKSDIFLLFLLLQPALHPLRQAPMLRLVLLCLNQCEALATEFGRQNQCDSWTLKGESQLSEEFLPLYLFCHRALNEGLGESPSAPRLQLPSQEKAMIGEIPYASSVSNRWRLIKLNRKARHHLELGAFRVHKLFLQHTVALLFFQDEGLRS